MKTVTATHAAKSFGEFLDNAQREPVLVTKKNRPVGVMFSVEDARKLMNAKVDVSIQRGLDDVKAGRHAKLTPEYGAALRERFEAEIMKTKSHTA